MKEYYTLGEWFKMGYVAKVGATSHFLMGKEVYSKEDVVPRKEEDRCTSNRAEAFFRGQK